MNDLFGSDDATAVPRKVAKPRRASLKLMMLKEARKDVRQRYYARFGRHLEDAAQVTDLAKQWVERNRDELYARAELECAKIDLTRALKAHGKDINDYAPGELDRVALEVVELRRAEAAQAAEQQRAAAAKRDRQIPMRLAGSEDESTLSTPACRKP